MPSDGITSMPGVTAVLDQIELLSLDACAQAIHIQAASAQARSTATGLAEVLYANGQFAALRRAVDQAVAAVAPESAQAHLSQLALDAAIAAVLAADEVDPGITAPIAAPWKSVTG